MKYLIIFLLSINFCIAQNAQPILHLPPVKKEKVDFSRYIIPGTLAFFSGMADGLNQTINYHYDKFDPNHSRDKFWNPKVSWKNKYKDWDGGDKRAAFPLAKTSLVALTDGHHLTRMLDRSFLIGSLVYNFKDGFKGNRWYIVGAEIAGIMLVRSAGFELTYSIIYK